MIKLEDYKFNVSRWPPPKELRNRDTYLFGFDEGLRPYVVRWEMHPRQGWCGASLDDSYVGSLVTAMPVYLYPDEVDRKIKWWASAPLLKRTMAAISGGGR